MDKLNRIADLKRLFGGRRHPVPLAVIGQQLECSESTARRALRTYRDDFGAPLVYDRQRRGWRLDPETGSTDEPADELPGFWFKPSELQALLTARELLREIEPGILSAQLEPIATRLETLLAQRGIDRHAICKRVRLIAIGARPHPSAGFASVVHALLERRRLRIRYLARGHESAVQHDDPREVSPQRLSWYRSNWYLEAWCHQAGALRRFALDRIAAPQPLDQAACEVPQDQLDQYFASAFGIFAGPPDAQAVLHFSPHRARWVAAETWHADQEAAWLPDGRYQLSLPYRSEHPEELLMDILKYGPDCKVLAPPALRTAVRERLCAALAHYAADLAVP